jgi:hypothetical protein
MTADEVVQEFRIEGYIKKYDPRLYVWHCGPENAKLPDRGSRPDQSEIK